MSEFLTPLTGAVKSRPFIVLDIESKDEDTQRAGFTRPFMTGVYDGETFYPHYDKYKEGDWRCRYFWTGGNIDLAMRQILSKKFRGYHIYAHNAGRFDFLFLLPWLMHTGKRYGYNFQIIPVSSAIQVLDVWHGHKRRHRWRFLDSYKLIPLALDKAAKTFGLEGKLEHDLNLPESDPQWVNYLRQDCVQLYEVVSKFHDYIEKVLLGEVGVTAPATSMKLLRRRYLKKELPRSIDTHDFAREAYVGGRVEVFREYGEKLRYYDLNSSYPAAMLQPMPAGEAIRWDGTPPARFIEEGRIGFVRANIYVPPDVVIPPLPVRGTTTTGVPKKLLFPVGHLSGVWDWAEIKMALDVGCELVTCFESVWYEPVLLFREFVETLYVYRDKSLPGYDEGLALIAKLLMNSLYGKFGMRTLRRTIYQFDDPKMPENAVPASADPESLVWYAEVEVDADYIMPQVSAHVTSLGRVSLFENMLKTLGNLHYVDTDSIITPVELPTSTDLGALKDELPDYSGQLQGRFIQPKVYILRAPGYEQVKAKGLQKDRELCAACKRIITMSCKECERLRVKRNIETVERLAAGDTIHINRLEKVGSLAQSGFLRGPRMLTIPRRLLKDQAKRIVQPDGSTLPHNVKMWT